MPEKVLVERFPSSFGVWRRIATYIDGRAVATHDKNSIDRSPEAALPYMKTALPYSPKSKGIVSSL